MNSPSSSLTRRIRTVHYKDQRFSNAELDLLHTPSLQRLYDLRQLGFADRVYIDASHTRLAHVLGVMEIASQLCRSIAGNLAAQRRKRGPFQWTHGAALESMDTPQVEKFVRDRTEAVRLIALLHDLTHAPFGHTLEDEIKLVDPSHDDPGRQAAAFARLLMEYLVWTAMESAILPLASGHDPRSEVWLAGEGDAAMIDEERAVALGIALLDGTDASFGRTRLKPAELAHLLINLNFATRALYYLEVSHKFEAGKYQEPEPSYLVNRLIEQMLRGSKKNEEAKQWAAEETNAGLVHEMKFVPLRDAYCVDLIGNTICADLLDYANRDATSSGLPLAFDVARIVEHFTLISYREGEAKHGHPFCGIGLRAAVEFSNTKFRGDVIGELMQLLQVRYYVYERMLFHPTKCVAGAMLGRAVQLLGFTTTIPARWQLTGDAVFLEELGEASRLIATEIESLWPDAEERATTKYDPNVAAKLEARLIKPVLPVVECARAAVRQRVLTIGSLKKEFASDMPGPLWIARYLYTIGKLKPHAEMLALDQLPEVLRSEPWHPSDAAQRKEIDAKSVTPEVLAELASAVAARLKSDDMPLAEAQSVAKTAFEKLIPSIADVLQQTHGTRLLSSRLGARRFAKRIFCLLPRNIMAKDITLDRAMIAKRFLDPNVRSAAERAIERVGNLRPGSVVIHCPPASGPKKLAQVIVTYIQPDKPGSIEERRASKILRHIGQIDGPAAELFQSHQGHIKSMETMYASMWRLWVAVAPPLDKEYKSLGKIVGNVMSAVVFAGGPHNVIENDAFMVEELNDLYTPREDPIPPTVETRPPEVSRVVKGTDQALSRVEVEAILAPYLATFAKSRRTLVDEHLTKLDLVNKLAERSRTPAFRQRLSRMQISVPLAAVSWDARDIGDFVEVLQSWTDTEQEFLDVEASRHRHFQKAEREAKDALSRDIARRLINLRDVTNEKGAVRVAALLRRERNLRVVFQPLLTPGLYATSGREHVILIDCAEHDPEELTKIYESGEAERLLPARIRFTLAHEYVHFLIATGDDPTIRAHRDDERVGDIAEMICQELAAEVLISAEKVDQLCRQTIFSPTDLDAACRELGVNIRPLIIRLNGADAFLNLPHGLAIVYARRDRTGDLVNIKCAASRALSGPIETLRDVEARSSLPIPDVLNGSDTAESILRISDSSKNRKSTEPVRIKMMRSPTDSPAEFRLAVVLRE